MRKKILTFISIFLIFTSIFISGCVDDSPEPEGTWDDVVSDYDPKTNQFPNFNKTVAIKDTLKSLEYKDEYQQTKIYLRSNDNTPLYIDETDEVSKNDLTEDYFAGDEIIFTIYIAEDDQYGEYVEETKA